jgi:hypothetical protein
MPIGELLAKLYNLKRDKGSGWEKPYKPALLLALIDLLEQTQFLSGVGTAMAQNRFSLSDALINRYRDYIAIVTKYIRPGPMYEVWISTTPSNDIRKKLNK